MTIQSIKIGKLIHATLAGDTRLTQALGDCKVYPIVAPNETTFPFCVYQRDNVTPYRLTKDGIAGDTVTFSVVIASDSYFESVDIASLAREALEKKYVENNEICMVDTYMTSIRESYEASTYVQQMQFTTRVNNKTTA